MLLLGEQVINKITSARNNFRMCSFLHRDVIVKAYFLGSRVCLGRWHLSQDMNSKWLFSGKVHFRHREEQKSWWGRESVWMPTWASRVMKFKMLRVSQCARPSGHHRKTCGVGILSLTQPHVQLGHHFHRVWPVAHHCLKWLPSPPCLAASTGRPCGWRHLRNMKCCTIFRWYHYLKTRYPWLRDLDFGGSNYLVDQIFWGELQSPP